MNYQKIYEDLIQKAKTENRQKSSKQNINYVYYENHHIIPRCLGGLDIEENLILLTYREHYMAHKLLTFIYPKKMGIIYAFKFMSKLYKKSKDYAYARQLYNDLPASEKTKERRLEVWFDINCSEKAINEYIESLKNYHYSPSEDPIIHIPLIEKNEIYILNKNKLQKNIKYYNNKGCKVSSNF